MTQPYIQSVSETMALYKYLSAIGKQITQPWWLKSPQNSGHNHKTVSTNPILIKNIRHVNEKVVNLAMLLKNELIIINDFRQNGQQFGNIVEMWILIIQE